MSPLDRFRFRDLYRVMLTARRVDELEDELVSRGEAFFHVSAAGHEGVAVLHQSLIASDWLHCHYRDKALLLARGIPPRAFLDALLCNADSHSAGRQMSAHMSDPARHVLSMVGPVGNNALCAVGIASALKDDPSRRIIVCAIGDGTSQQGEVLEAVAEAVRSRLPILFFIEDNGLSISTRTGGKTFYDLPGTKPDEFYGLPIHRLDGRDVVLCDAKLALVVGEVRQKRHPALVVFEVDRLCTHTNADDERAYRNAEEIARVRAFGDPIRLLAARLLSSGVTQRDLDEIAATVESEVRSAAEDARRVGDPKPISDAKKPLPPELTSATSEYRGDSTVPRLTMLEAMREVLRHRLAADKRVMLFGEDIEDPKGDVFGLTKGLTKAFPGRVINSALSESTILGVSIGRALAGGRSVAFLQFADFIPLAFNQICTELGSMFWRTQGGWECPVIVMVACGAYRPGLGPFHSHTLESIIAHVPGLDVFMPSTASDAAGLLNAAFASGRPTLFFYPKVCLNDRERCTSADVNVQFVPIGKSHHITKGNDLTLVSWGSTIPLCERSAQTLQAAGFAIDLIDLRSISPWDEQAVCGSARRTGKLIVVHEDNLTCGFGAEIAAAVSEAISSPLVVRRVTRPDTYVPCNFSCQLAVLPSYKRIMTVAAEVLDVELTWELPAAEDASVFVVEATGASPADQTVIVGEWLVKIGDQVECGQPIANLEADKAAFEMAAPRDGIVNAVLVPAGQSVRVGEPLLRIRTTDRGNFVKRPTREESGTAQLRRRAGAGTKRSGSPDFDLAVPVGVSAIYTKEGMHALTNSELAMGFPGRSAEEIFQLTGIEIRHRMAPEESAVTMATEAARRALVGEGITIQDIDAVICSTTTPPMVTPSTACLVLYELCQGSESREIPAHDVNAACTGYLYALAAAFDFIQSHPSARVLVVTTEAMSRIINPADFSTAIIFGDAASATILTGTDRGSCDQMLLSRPLLSAKGESGAGISVGLPGNRGYVEMEGRKVFSEAVRQMMAMLQRSCRASELRIADLDLIVPHQANERILDALRNRLNLPPGRVFSNIRYHGNTSSSSIPLALAELEVNRGNGDGLVGLVAFGGGFTSGAAILSKSGLAHGIRR